MGMKRPGHRCHKCQQGECHSVAVRHDSNLVNAFGVASLRQDNSSLSRRISMDGAIFSCRIRYTDSAMGMSTSYFWFSEWMPCDPVNPSATMSISSERIREDHERGEAAELLVPARMGGRGG